MRSPDDTFAAEVAARLRPIARALRRRVERAQQRAMYVGLETRGLAEGERAAASERWRRVAAAYDAAADSARELQTRVAQASVLVDEAVKGPPRR
jgi:hypothetical protein